MMAMMIAITFILMNTPLGTIPLGAISVTIAHIPILLATILFGLRSGLIMAFIFGVMSLLTALIAPNSVLDPLFINPLISILPRMFIPLTTYAVYKSLAKVNNTVAIILATAIGNLTNTLFVYLSLYFFASVQVEVILGKSFASAIIGMISLSTLIKTILVVAITTPLILALQRYLGINIKKKTDKKLPSHNDKGALQ